MFWRGSLVLHYTIHSLCFTCVQSPRLEEKKRQTLQGNACRPYKVLSSMRRCSVRFAIANGLSEEDVWSWISHHVPHLDGIERRRYCCVTYKYYYYYLYYDYRVMMCECVCDWLAGWMVVRCLMAWDEMVEGIRRWWPRSVAMGNSRLGWVETVIARADRFSF